MFSHKSSTKDVLFSSYFNVRIQNILQRFFLRESTNCFKRTVTFGGFGCFREACLKSRKTFPPKHLPNSFTHLGNLPTSSGFFFLFSQLFPKLYISLSSLVGKLVNILQLFDGFSQRPISWAMHPRQAECGVKRWIAQYGVTKRPEQMLMISFVLIPIKNPHPNLFPIF